MANAFSTIVMPEALCDAANNLALCLAEGGRDTFMRQCSPTGQAPATHRIMSGMIDAQFAALLDAPQMIFAVAQQLAPRRGIEMTCTLQDCIDMHEQADISDADPYDRMAHLGLSFLETEDE